MSKVPAERVDVTLLALQGARVERRWPVAELERFRELLLSPQGSALALIEFQQVEGVPAARLTVQATVELRCQRCLQPFACPVESRTQLAFVAPGAADAPPVPEGWETIEVDPHRVALVELVEDELLLSLPLVPRHAADDCAQAVAAIAEADITREPVATQRPFADLKQLLKH